MRRPRDCRRILGFRGSTGQIREALVGSVRPHNRKRPRGCVETAYHIKSAAGETAIIFFGAMHAFRRQEKHQPIPDDYVCSSPIRMWPGAIAHALLTRVHASHRTVPFDTRI